MWVESVIKTDYRVVNCHLTFALWCNSNVTTETHRLYYLYMQGKDTKPDIFSPLTGGCSEGLGAF